MANMSLEGFKSHRASGLVQHTILATEAAKTVKTLGEKTI